MFKIKMIVFCYESKIKDKDIVYWFH